jgi:hypothetical protein
VIVLYYLELNSSFVFFLLAMVKTGGWCTSTSCWDVSVCQYTKRDDKGPCILLNAISDVWRGTSTHSESTCNKVARSCCLMHFLGVLTRIIFPLILVLCSLSYSCFYFLGGIFYCNFSCTNTRLAEKIHSDGKRKPQFFLPWTITGQILVYLFLFFRGISKAWKFGFCRTISKTHCYLHVCSLSTW